MTMVRYSIPTLFILMMSFFLPTIAWAQEPTETVVTSITEAACLAAGAEYSSLPSADGVWIEWQGEIKEARMIVRIAGADASHTITINGQPVANVPIYPDGEVCGGQEFVLEIPADAIYQGENLIAITNDALSSDSWTAANVRLKVITDYQPDAEPIPQVNINAVSFTKLQTILLN